MWSLRPVSKRQKSKGIVSGFVSVLASTADV